MTTQRKVTWLADQIALAKRGVEEWPSEKRSLARFEGAEHGSRHETSPTKSNSPRGGYCADKKRDSD